MQKSLKLLLSIYEQLVLKLERLLSVSSWEKSSQTVNALDTFHKLPFVRWPIDRASASHQCGPGSIPGWGSDPGALSEKGLTSPV